ncbi:(Fe-S)-binding protein [Methanosphaera sp. WGK6]|uniref:(Fe-S)-binding protein n=1 Tax=Methanosphaera sp. WGK6 TaxID=1561964 RepID=UPI00084CA922|nr:(Fe-S)-binding protein [Methanosphaera sp. WGK6]OED30377.1 hypothetical protein NL43_03115 [Methanosphaera sp. WGK6]
MSYADKIRNNILEKKNTYGADMTYVDDGEIHEVILHRGCTARFREIELVDFVTRCLDKKNIKYSVLSDESCCGVMLFELDDYKTGEKVVHENIKKFKKHGVKKIITICPGCYESFTQHYTDNPEFDIEVIFAMDLFNDEFIDGTGHVIHDPCHALERSNQIRSIIGNVPKRRANSCCGFGAGMKAGSKNLTRKMAIDTLSGDKVITYCPSCYHTLRKVNPDNCIDFFDLMSKNL